MTLLSFVGVFLIVAMTLDRFLAVRYPHNFQKWRTPKHAWKVGLSIFVFCVLYCMPFMYTADLIGGTVCSGS